MPKERIISADSHVAIRDEAVIGHLASKHHEAYQQARAEAMARTAKKAKPRKPGPNAGLPVGGADRPWDAAGRPGEYDPIERLKDMDLDGVEAEVLYTNVEVGVSYNAMPNGGRLAAFQAFNNAALDFAATDPKRLIVVYIIPIADIDEAVGEVQRLAREGARAFMLPLYPTDLELPPYFDPHYDKLWGAIQETGIPISQHVGANDALWNILRYDTTAAKGIFQSLPPIFMAEVIANWIVGGVFERFPGRGRARLDSLLPGPARHDETTPRLGPLRHAEGAAEQLLAQQHGGDLRGGHLRYRPAAQPGRGQSALGHRLPASGFDLARVAASSGDPLQRCPH
jgi:predicted TIM-barrel fold metal-dependent hydrolase